MSDEKVLETVKKDVLGAEASAAENADWAKNWKVSDLVSPSPYSTKISEVTAQSPVIEHLAEQGLEIDNEQLDAAINDILKSPEIDAMLENVAADAADDLSRALDNARLPIYLTNSGGSDYLQVLRNDFEEFKKKVTAAFKHAGFKF